MIVLAAVVQVNLPAADIIHGSATGILVGGVTAGGLGR